MSERISVPVALASVLLATAAQPSHAEEPNKKIVNIADICPSDLDDHILGVSGAINGVSGGTVEVKPYGVQDGSVAFFDVKHSGEDACFVAVGLEDDGQSWDLVSPEGDLTRIIGLDTTCEESIGSTTINVVPYDATAECEDAFVPEAIMAAAINSAHFDKEVDIVFGADERTTGKIFAVGASSEIVLFSPSTKNYYSTYALETQANGNLTINISGWGAAAEIDKEDLDGFYQNSGGIETFKFKDDFSAPSGQDVQVDAPEPTAPTAEATNENTTTNAVQFGSLQDYLRRIEMTCGLAYYYEELDMYRGGHNPDIFCDMGLPIASTRFFVGPMLDYVIPVSSGDDARGGFGRALWKVGRDFDVNGRDLAVAVAFGQSWDYNPVLNAKTTGVHFDIPAAQFGNYEAGLYFAVHQDLLMTGHLDPSIYAGLRVKGNPLAWMKPSSPTYAAPEDLVISKSSDKKTRKLLERGIEITDQYNLLLEQYNAANNAYIVASDALPSLIPVPDTDPRILANLEVLRGSGIGSEVIVDRTDDTETWQSGYGLVQYDYAFYIGPYIDASYELAVDEYNEEPGRMIYTKAHKPADFQFYLGANDWVEAAWTARGYITDGPGRMSYKGLLFEGMFMNNRYSDGSVTTRSGYKFVGDFDPKTLSISGNGLLVIEDKTFIYSKNDSCIYTSEGAIPVSFDQTDLDFKIEHVHPSSLVPTLIHDLHIERMDAFADLSEVADELKLVVGEWAAIDHTGDQRAYENSSFGNIGFELNGMAQANEELTSDIAMKGVTSLFEYFDVTGVSLEAIERKLGTGYELYALTIANGSVSLTVKNRTGRLVHYNSVVAAPHALENRGQFALHAQVLPTKKQREPLQSNIEEMVATQFDVLPAFLYSNQVKILAQFSDKRREHLSEGVAAVFAEFAK
jgi:hypothetical protein